MLSKTPKYFLFKFLQNQGLSYILQDPQKKEKLSIHYPVLYREVLSSIQQYISSSKVPKQLKLLDCTIGTGAHAQILLNDMPNLHIHGMDLDSRMIEHTRLKLDQFQQRLILKQGNFSSIDLKNYPYDIVFADLGYNINQVQGEGYGLSYRENEAKLDMRYEAKGKSASDILNKCSNQEIFEILSQYGEIKKASQITKEIVKERENQKIEYVSQLTKACIQAGGQGQIPQVFQALRIVVNQELINLETLLNKFLKTEKDFLALIITFHSLESEIIKKFIKNNKKFAKGDKIIVPSQIELQENPRSRSAKMFIIKIKSKN